MPDEHQGDFTALDKQTHMHEIDVISDNSSIIAMYGQEETLDSDFLWTIAERLDENSLTI